MSEHYREQIGGYVIALLHAKSFWHVRMAGAEEYLSEHNSKKDAQDAVRRYQSSDKRRSK